MIDQPPTPDDLLDAAELRTVLRTSICLDESIRSARHARRAFRLGSCRIVNIKVGRVGGQSEALRIHVLCRASGIPVWCSGMRESGIGRAYSLALASLPGDTREIVTPDAASHSDGTAPVPVGSGIGMDVEVEYVDACSESVDRTEASAAAALP
jgi:O-succinylbenzoate synthase